MDVKLRILIELLILYSLVYFTEFLRIFAQLKWSGRVYTLKAVSGLILLIKSMLLPVFGSHLKPCSVIMLGNVVVRLSTS